MTELDDAALLRAAREGDFGAFERLVYRYRQNIYRFLMGMLRQPSDAEEALQDVFLNLFRALGQYRGEGSISAWIYKTAANTALMRLRSDRRKPLHPVELPEAVAAHGGAASVWRPGAWSRPPEQIVLNRELGERIAAAVEALPEEHRAVLLLRDVLGQTTAEVASALDLTPSAVKTRLHRSRMRVRQALEPYFELGADDAKTYLTDTGRENDET